MIFFFIGYLLGDKAALPPGLKGKVLRFDTACGCEGCGIAAKGGQ